MGPLKFVRVNPEQCRCVGEHEEERFGVAEPEQTLAVQLYRRCEHKRSWPLRRTRGCVVVVGVGGVPARSWVRDIAQSGTGMRVVANL